MSEDKFQIEVERREHYHFHRLQIQLKNVLIWEDVTYILPYHVHTHCKYVTSLLFLPTSLMLEDVNHRLVSGRFRNLKRRVPMLGEAQFCRVSGSM